MSSFKKTISDYGFWTTLFALIPLIAQAFGILHLPPNYTELVNGILALLVAGGVVKVKKTNSKSKKKNNSQ